MSCSPRLRGIDASVPVVKGRGLGGYPNLTKWCQQVKVEYGCVLSCSEGGISVEEKIRIFKSSIVCVSGSISIVVTPLGWRTRIYASPQLIRGSLRKIHIQV
jgi:hypothetical protein